MLPTDDLLAEVAADTGLDDYGEPTFREGLERLLWSLEHEAALNEIGEIAADTMIRGHLRNRLRITDWWQRHPELGAETIDRPVLLVGLARSGTTALSHLLGADPRWRSLRQWEANDSVPPPTTATYDTDPRFLAAIEAGDGMAALNPDFKKIHEDPPDAPIECVVLLCQTFVSLLYPTVWHLPSYTEWVLTTDHTPAVDYHRRALQLLQSQHPGRWQLKTPQHGIALDELRAAHPEAAFVVTHRDPAVCTASVASLFDALGGPLTTGINKGDLGREAVHVIGGLADGLVAHARTHGTDAFVHLDYEEMRTDRMGTVRRLYDEVGMELTPDVEAALQAHVDASPQGKHGRHTYDPADYGLDADELDERFAAYRDTFGLG